MGQKATIRNSCPVPSFLWFRVRTFRWVKMVEKSEILTEETKQFLNIFPLFYRYN